MQAIAAFRGRFAFTVRPSCKAIAIRNCFRRHAEQASGRGTPVTIQERGIGAGYKSRGGVKGRKPETIQEGGSRGCCKSGQDGLDRSTFRNERRCAINKRAVGHSSGEGRLRSMRSPVRRAKSNIVLSEL